MNVETLRNLQHIYMLLGYDADKAFELAFYQLKRDLNK